MKNMKTIPFDLAMAKEIHEGKRESSREPAARKRRISNKQWISEYLKNKDFTSPSEIGRAHAKAFNLSPWTHHSAWASPICKKMVAEGILVRNENGKYKLKGHESTIQEVASESGDADVCASDRRWY